MAGLAHNMLELQETAQRIRRCVERLDDERSGSEDASKPGSKKQRTPPAGRGRASPLPRSDDYRRLRTLRSRVFKELKADSADAELEDSDGSSTDSNFLSFQDEELQGWDEGFNLLNASAYVQKLMGDFRVDDRVHTTQLIKDWFDKATANCEKMDIDLDDKEEICNLLARESEMAYREMNRNLDLRNGRVVRYMRKFHGQIQRLRLQAPRPRARGPQAGPQAGLSTASAGAADPGSGAESLSEAAAAAPATAAATAAAPAARPAPGRGRGAGPRAEAEGKAGAAGPEQEASTTAKPKAKPESRKMLASDLLEVVAQQQEEIAHLRTKTEMEGRMADTLKAVLEYLRAQQLLDEANGGRTKSAAPVSRNAPRNNGANLPSLTDAAWEMLKEMREASRVKHMNELFASKEGREFLTQCALEHGNQGLEAQTRNAEAQEEASRLVEEVKLLEREVQKIPLAAERVKMLQQELAVAKRRAASRRRRPPPALGAAPEGPEAAEASARGPPAEAGGGPAASREGRLALRSPGTDLGPEEDAPAGGPAPKLVTFTRRSAVWLQQAPEALVKQVEGFHAEMAKVLKAFEAQMERFSSSVMAAKRQAVLEARHKRLGIVDFDAADATDPEAEALRKAIKVGQAAVQELRDEFHDLQRAEAELKAALKRYREQRKRLDAATAKQQRRSVSPIPRETTPQALAPGPASPKSATAHAPPQAEQPEGARAAAVSGPKLLEPGTSDLHPDVQQAQQELKELEEKRRTLQAQVDARDAKAQQDGSVRVDSANSATNASESAGSGGAGGGGGALPSGPGAGLASRGGRSSAAAPGHPPQGRPVDLATPEAGSLATVTVLAGPIRVAAAAVTVLPPGDALGVGLLQQASGPAPGPRTTRRQLGAAVVAMGSRVAAEAGTTITPTSVRIVVPGVSVEAGGGGAASSDNFGNGLLVSGLVTPGLASSGPQVAPGTTVGTKVGPKLHVSTLALNGIAPQDSPGRVGLRGSVLRASGPKGSGLLSGGLPSGADAAVPGGLPMPTAAESAEPLAADAAAAAVPPGALVPAGKPMSCSSTLGGLPGAVPGVLPQSLGPSGATLEPGTEGGAGRGAGFEEAAEQSKARLEPVDAKTEGHVQELLDLQADAERLWGHILHVEERIREAKTKSQSVSGSMALPPILPEVGVPRPPDHDVPEENKALRREVGRRQRELKALRTSWQERGKVAVPLESGLSLLGQAESAAKLLLHNPPLGPLGEDEDGGSEDDEDLQNFGEEDEARNEWGLLVRKKLSIIDVRPPPDHLQARKPTLGPAGASRLSPVPRMAFLHDSGTGVLKGRLSSADLFAGFFGPPVAPSQVPLHAPMLVPEASRQRPSSSTDAYRASASHEELAPQSNRLHPQWSRSEGPPQGPALVGEGGLAAASPGSQGL